jgi:hypothetical protein
MLLSYWAVCQGQKKTTTNNAARSTLKSVVSTTLFHLRAKLPAFERSWAIGSGAVAGH